MKKTGIALITSLIVVAFLIANIATSFAYLPSTPYTWGLGVPNYNPSAVINTGTIDTSLLVTGDFLGVSSIQPNAPGYGDSGVSVGWDDSWVGGVGHPNTNGDNLDGLWAQIIYPAEGWWDLGFATDQVIVFLSQDHGPYLAEGLETRVYGSNTLWGAVSAQAVLTDVYLDGWRPHNPAEDGNGNGWCSDDIAGVYKLPGMYRYVKIAAWSSVPALNEPEVDAVATWKRALDKRIHKKVKVIPAPVQFWREFIGGVTDIIVSDPPDWPPEGVALVREYAILHNEGHIPLELLTWEGTEGLPWEPIDTPEEPYILLPGESAYYDIPTVETDTAVLVRYTVAWASSQDVIETKFVNEAILEKSSPQVIVGQLSNFDVHNDYHEPVDNFELELYGIQPSDIVDWFPGWGTPPEINPIPPSGGMPGGTEIIWIDPDHPVMPCQWEHFGLHLKPGVIAEGVKAYWTQLPSAKLGDVIHTKIEVTVPGGETVTVVDKLPPDVAYLNGTFTVDGVPATPTITKTGTPPHKITEISYTITTLGTHLIEFDCKVDTAYWEDREVCNVVTATWYDEETVEAIETKEDFECFIIHAFEHLRKDLAHDDWPMFHHDLALSGVSDSPAPNTNATLWIYDTGSSVSSSPAVVDGRLYIGAYNGKLYAIDANTGALLWTYQTGGAIYSSPAVAYGRVYFLSTDGKVYALNAVTGALVWSRMIGPGSWDWSSPAVHNGRVFIATSTGWVYCLGAATGAVIWRTNIGAQPNGPIAVVNGKVYSGTHNFNALTPTLFALDELSGAVIWTYSYTTWHPGAVGFINSNGVSVADGDGDGDLEVYFGVVIWQGIGNQAICLDEATGNEVWTQNLNGWSTSTPAVHNGVVFIGSDDTNLYALNAATGAYIWTFKTGAAIWSAPAVADGKVFVASLDHFFYALDETTGSLIWYYDTSKSRMEGSPAVACGKVFVGNENGKIFAWGSPSYNPLIIKEKTEVQWKIEIAVTNPFPYTMTNVMITDNFGAEIEIDDIVLMADCNGDAEVNVLDLMLVARAFGTDESYPQGTGWHRWNSDCDFNRNGKVDGFDLYVAGQGYGSYASMELVLDETGMSEKVHLTWYIGNLAPGKTARLVLLVSTDLNPAGHQEYTEPGIYEMNSGATLKFIDPEQNMQLSAVTEPIYVTVLPAEDP